MKKVTHILALAIAVFMLLGTAGCSKEVESSPWEPVLATELDLLPHTFSNEGYYYVNHDGLLCFLDLKNGQNVILCSKVGCLHSDEPDIFKRRECEAQTGAQLLFFWDNGLYFLCSDVYGYQLYRRAADGTAEEHIINLCENYKSKDTSVQICSLTLAEGMLYYQADIYENIQVGPNEISTQLSYSVICQVDLRTRKETELIRNNGGVLNMYAARNDAVLYMSYEIIEQPENITDPSYIEKLDSRKVWLNQWNRQDGKTEILLEKTIGELTQVEGFANGKLFYNDETFETLWSYDMETGTIVAAGSAQIVEIINDRYVLRYRTPFIRSIYDLQSGAFIESAFLDTSLTVEDVCSHGFIIRRECKADEETTADTILSYVSFQALQDGLQESDALDFYIYGTGNKEG